LDVDLWYWAPDAANKRALTRQEREDTKARSVLDPKTSSIRSELSARVITLLHLTAQDAHVERIFVHPIIKRDACKSAQGDRAWLHKLRPWYGHDDHFHVRLECPAGATDCVAQTPSARGDGCAELDWWFSPEANEDRKKGMVTYQSKVGKAPGMPEQCKAVLGRADKPAAQHAGAKPVAKKPGSVPLQAAGRTVSPEAPPAGPAQPTAAGPGASL
jgi:penicillin-insensitive murein endopeptidase